MKEAFTQDEVAVTRKTLDATKGVGLGILKTPDNCISSLVLGVVYLDPDEDEIVGGDVSVSDGSIGDAMKEVHTAAVKKAEDAGLEPGNDGYPENLDAVAAWDAAKGKLNELLEDGVEVPDGKTALEAIAEELVAMLAHVGPAGQKWGRKMLLDVYRSKAK